MGDLRRRRSDEGQAEEIPSSSNTSESQLPKNEELKSRGRSSRRKLLFFLCRLPSLACLAALIYGIYLNHKYLYTHEECDMTWSHREFIPIALPSSSSKARGYGLFKFVDRRDPRQQKLLAELNKQTESTISMSFSDWCYSPPNDASKTTAVLYIPGHGGSYQQARSLGAHGLQMTQRQLSRQQLVQAQTALMTAEWTGNATKLDQFVYDVFAFDFLEEPTGLHGAFLEAQAEFILQTVHYLIDACQFQQIAVVAHSMGGYAAELARILDPSIRPYIRNMITLGTPHAHPSLVWEHSLYQIHKRIQHESNDFSLAVIAISGGVADALIPPRTCDASVAHTASTTILATEIMTNAMDDNNKRPPTLGMDHQAIVWCHNLLTEVRAILHDLVVVHDRLSSMERVQQVQRAFTGMSSDYDRAGREQGEKLWVLFGWRAYLMDASLLYHAIWLVGFYCIIAGCHCLVPLLTMSSDSICNMVSWILLPLLATIASTLARESNELSVIMSLILSFAASGIFLSIHWFANRCLIARRVGLSGHRAALEAVAAMTLILAIVAATSIFVPRQFGMKEWLCVSSVLVVLSLSFLHMARLPRPTPLSLPASWSDWCPAALHHVRSPVYHGQALNARRAILLVWLLPLLPILLAGDMAVIWFHGQASERIFLTLVAPILCWLLLCLILDSLPRSYGQGRFGRLLLMLRFVTVVQGGSKLFRLELPHYGHGFASGTLDLVAQMVQLEILELLAVLFMARGATAPVKKG